MRDTLFLTQYASGAQQAAAAIYRLTTQYARLLELVEVLTGMQEADDSSRPPLPLMRVLLPNYEDTSENARPLVSELLLDTVPRELLPSVTVIIAYMADRTASQLQEAWATLDSINQSFHYEAKGSPDDGAANTNGRAESAFAAAADSVPDVQHHENSEATYPLDYPGQPVRGPSSGDS